MVKKVVKKKAPVKKKVAPKKKIATKKKVAPKKKAVVKKAVAKKHVDQPIRLITPSFVITFPVLFKPKQNDRGGDEYACTMYFDKETTDMSGIQGAIDQIIHDDYKGKKAGIKLPIRDGDDENDNYSTYEGTAGCWIVAAKSVFKPGAVDVDLEDIIDPSMIYPGAICRASITAFAYDVNGNKGVSFSLNNVQFLTDGEPLTGAGTKASDEFGEAEEAEYEEYEEPAEEEVEEEAAEEEVEEEAAEEEGVEVYENDDGIMVYLDEYGDEVEYNEDDFE